MSDKFIAVLKKWYPRHYLMKKPLAGMLVLALTNFGFLELYRPVMAYQAGATYLCFCNVEPETPV